MSIVFICAETEIFKYKIFLCGKFATHFVIDFVHLEAVNFATQTCELRGSIAVI